MKIHHVSMGKPKIVRFALSILCLVLILCVLTPLFLSLKAYAEGTDGFIEPFLTQRKTVVSGLSRYSPNTNSYPFGGDGLLISIGFDKLYGTERGLFTYYGEIPIYLKDDFNLRYYNGTKIGYETRKFSSVEDRFTKDDIVDDSDDPRIWAMTQTHDTVGEAIGGIGLSVVNAVHSVISFILDLCIDIKSLDFASLLDEIDTGDGEFTKMLSALFLVDTENGNALSPFLIFALFMFLIGLIGIAFRAYKGQGTFREVLKEILVLLGALIVASVFLVTNGPLKISAIGMDFMTALTNDISLASAGDAAALFEYDTGLDGKDNASTQKALINKIYIDSMIEAQTGFKVKDLYFVKNGSYTALAGFNSGNVDSAATRTFGRTPSNSAFAVQVDHRSGASARKVQNIGYWLWAANSNVAIKNSALTTAFSRRNVEAFGQYDVTYDTPERVLFVVDYLSELKAVTDSLEVDSAVDKFMQHLVHPQYGTAIIYVLLSLLQNAALTYGLFKITIFILIGEVIIILGSFCMVVMPALMLFKGARRTAKQMLWSYVLAFLRYLIGSALFNALIMINVFLAARGVAGIIVSIAVSILMGRYGQKVITEINSYINRTLGSRELGFINRAYSRTSYGRLAMAGAAGYGIGRLWNRNRNDKPASSGEGGNDEDQNDHRTASGHYSGRNPDGNDEEPNVDNEEFESPEKGDNGDHDHESYESTDDDVSTDNNKDEAPGSHKPPEPHPEKSNPFKPENSNGEHKRSNDGRSTDGSRNDDSDDAEKRPSRREDQTDKYGDDGRRKREKAEREKILREGIPELQGTPSGFRELIDEGREKSKRQIDDALRSSDDADGAQTGTLPYKPDDGREGAQSRIDNVEGQPHKTERIKFGKKPNSDSAEQNGKKEENIRSKPNSDGGETAFNIRGEEPDRRSYDPEVPAKEKKMKFRLTPQKSDGSDVAKTGMRPTTQKTDKSEE